MSNFMNKMLNIVGFETEEKYDAYEAPQEDITTSVYDEMPALDRIASRRSSRVVKIHESGNLQMRVVVIQPESFEEARDVTNHLKERKPVVMNLESVEKEVARRIVDFLSGAVYALDGDIQKITNGIFLIAPNNVGILGEEEAVQKSGLSWGN